MYTYTQQLAGASYFVEGFSLFSSPPNQLPFFFATNYTRRRDLHCFDPAARGKRLTRFLTCTRTRIMLASHLNHFWKIAILNSNCKRKRLHHVMMWMIYALTQYDALYSLRESCCSWLKPNLKRCMKLNRTKC